MAGFPNSYDTWLDTDMCGCSTDSRDVTRQVSQSLDGGR